MLEAEATHGAGLVHCIRKDIAGVVVACALQHAKKRFRRLPRPRMNAAAGPAAGEDPSAWLRRMHVTTKDHNRHSPGMFRLPKSLVKNGARESRLIEGEWMLLQWVGMWQANQVEVTYRTTLGFGIRTATALPSGSPVVTGVVEPDIEDPSACVNPVGTLFGPLSLVNAACQSCANIRFEKADALVWHGVLNRDVHKGCHLTAPYNVRGATCTQCGTDISPK